MLEEKSQSPYAFLHSTPVLAVSALLVVQAIFFYSFPTKEFVPEPPPLQRFSMRVGPWEMKAQTTLDAYTQSFLKADDTLSRTYDGPGAPGTVDLFVAFFKSQRGGVTPHSPKVCLPGNGWTEETSAMIALDVPGESAPIPVNRYVVSHGDERDLVFYWYQNPNRVIANEYMSKFYLIWDALRFHRSDEALIRVIVRIGKGANDPAEAKALQFIRDVFQPLKAQMWMPNSPVALLK